jgi:type IV secretion system protein VirB8
MEHSIDEALIENITKSSLPVKKENVKKVDDYLKAVQDFESDRVALAKGSAKTAWKVATGFGFIALMAVTAVVLLTPLKEIEPYLMRVDNTDGSVSILRPLQDAQAISYGELLDKYFARKFIIARNSYEWETIQDNYDLVNLMSGGVVFSSFNNYIKADNSPVKTFGDNKRIKVVIQDVTFLPSSSIDRTLAQVRFSRDIINNEGVTVPGFEPTFWNATITFDYRKKINTADERKLNPLGFQITSYTEDRVSIR